MNLKKNIILLVGGTVLLGAFFVLPFNRDWAAKVYSYWMDVQPQLKNLTVEKRMVNRFGTSYTISKTIAAQVQKMKGDSALVLLPSSAYFENYGIPYHVPEPAVFYYYTGLKTVWPNSKEAIQANWIAGISNKNVLILPVINQAVLLDSIRSYNKFPVAL